MGGGEGCEVGGGGEGCETGGGGEGSATVGGGFIQFAIFIATPVYDSGSVAIELGKQIVCLDEFCLGNVLYPLGQAELMGTSFKLFDVKTFISSSELFKVHVLTLGSLMA